MLTDDQRRAAAASLLAAEVERRPIPRGPGTQIYDVTRATEFAPALEIIDYRTGVPRAIVDTIADNAAFAAIVVGAAWCLRPAIFFGRAFPQS